MQNNLLGFEMLFEIQKPVGEMLFEIEKTEVFAEAIFFKQHFDTEEVILQQPGEQVPYFYSNTTTK